MEPIDLLWERLRDVSRFQFLSRSQTGIGWEGEGSGNLDVEELPDSLIYTENGTWRQTHGKELKFHNIYRWTRVGFLIRLEHLRFGAGNPVFLFDLSAGQDGIWRDLEPHACRLDHYSSTLEPLSIGFLLNWRVQGVNRDEVMEYRYF